MENGRDWELNNLINELKQGKQLVNQLKKQLDPSKSPENYDFLVEKIITSYEKALSMLNWGASMEPLQSSISMLESPISFAGTNSPISINGTDRDYKDQCHNDVYKKRKTLPQWTEQVKVCLGTGMEGPLDDGHSWRKYGQKDILGANFPRAYYRCTHRLVQGCLATKQVQRSDEDPSIFEITYRGIHTCTQSERKGPNSKLILEEKTEKERKIEKLSAKEEIFPSFPFPSTPMEGKENSFLGGFSLAFTTSDSDSFLGMGHNLQISESIVSNPSSFTNSLDGDFDFSLDQVEFDSNFPFDNEFFT